MASNNQWLTIDKQANHYQVQSTKKSENHRKQNIIVIDLLKGA